MRRKILSWRKAGTLNVAQTAEWAELKQVVNWLVEHLSHQQQLLVSASINGLGLIGSVICLPLPDSVGDEPMDISIAPNEFSKQYVGKKLLFLIRSAHSRQKIREEAAHGLGHLAVGDPATFTQWNLNEFIKMLKLVRIHQNQYHFEILVRSNFNELFSIFRRKM